MAQILITGGAGYVGSHCAKTLARAGHEIVVYDNLGRGHKEFVRWGPLAVGDIRDADALARVVASKQFDAVLHFAAFAYVGESMSDPSLYYDNNIGGTRVLLDALHRARVTRLVFSSSCAVYGEPDILPIRENTRLAPINPYGFSKLVCERMMDDFDAAYGLKTVRLRYFNAAGADPEGEVGEWHDPEPHLIPLVIDAALGFGKPVHVFGTDYATPDGTAIRDYIHVADLADAHLRALEYLLGGGETLAVNLGTGQGLSVREIMSGVEKLSGRRVPFVEAPRRPGDPAILVADPSCARESLGWVARRKTAETMLRDAIGWRLKSASPDEAKCRESLSSI